MKNLPISHLILIMIDENNEIDTRISAEIEFYRRMSKFDLNKTKFIDEEESKMQKRGINIENYLFKENVTMQDLIETYLTLDHNLLTFSELHLCNRKDTLYPFFRKIISTEILNIDELIEELLAKSSNESEIEYLQSYQEILEKRIKERQEKTDTLSYLENYGITYIPNYQIICSTSLLSLLKNEIVKMLRETNVVQMPAIYKLILEDEKLLKGIKKKLMKEVKQGFEVNYDVDVLKRKKLN